LRDGTTLIYRERHDPRNRRRSFELKDRKMLVSTATATAITIIVTPLAKRPGFFRASTLGAPLVVSRQPLLDGARELLRRGASPEATSRTDRSRTMRRRVMIRPPASPRELSNTTTAAAAGGRDGDPSFGGWRNRMSLGKRKGSDFMPILKFDARVGTFCLQDRVNRDGIWKNEQTDVTKQLRGIFDLETVERGWIHFPKGAAPELVMVPPGEDPGGAAFNGSQRGLPPLREMTDELGGEVREFMSTALAAWNAIDALHTAYLKLVPKHPAQLPVVELFDVIEKKTASGSSFIPCFKIVDWVPRPADMPKAKRATGENGNVSRNAAPKLSKATDLDEIPF
jgi:hypothetical protein